MQPPIPSVPSAHSDTPVETIRVWKPASSLLETVRAARSSYDPPIKISSFAVGRMVIRTPEAEVREMVENLGTLDREHQRLALSWAWIWLLGRERRGVFWTSAHDAVALIGDECLLPHYREGLMEELARYRRRAEERGA